MKRTLNAGNGFAIGSRLVLWGGLVAAGLSGCAADPQVTGADSEAASGESRAAYSNNPNNYANPLPAALAVAPAWNSPVPAAAVRHLGESGWLSVAPRHEALRAQVFTVQPNQPAFFKTQGGLELNVPKNGFEYEDGSPITNEVVHLTVREALTVSDFFDAGLATTAGNQVLLSGGMYHFEATAPSRRAVRFNRRNAPTASFPVPEERPQGFQLFQGNRTPQGGLDWNALPGTQAVNTFNINADASSYDDLVVYYDLPTETREALTLVRNRVGQIARLNGLGQLYLPEQPQQVQAITQCWSQALRVLSADRTAANTPDLRRVTREHIITKNIPGVGTLSYVWASGKLYVRKDQTALLGMPKDNEWLDTRGYFYKPSLAAPGWLRAEYTNITKMYTEMAEAVPLLLALDFDKLGSLGQSFQKLQKRMGYWASQTGATRLQSDAELLSVLEDRNHIDAQYYHNWRVMRFRRPNNVQSTSAQRIAGWQNRRRLQRFTHNYYTVVHPAARIDDAYLGTQAFINTLRHDSLLMAFRIPTTGFVMADSTGAIRIQTQTDAIALAALSKLAVSGDTRDYERQMLTQEAQVALAMNRTPDRGSLSSQQGIWVARTRVVTALYFAGWYNIDRFCPFPKVPCAGQMLTADGTPARNQAVYVFSPTERLMLYTATDADGFFSIQVPKGMPMQVACYVAADTTTNRPALAIRKDWVSTDNSLTSNSEASSASITNDSRNPFILHPTDQPSARVWFRSSMNSRNSGL